MPRDNAALEADLFAELEGGRGAMRIAYIAPEQIEAPSQTRKYFDDVEHKNLVASIDAVGIRQPLQVRRVEGTRDQYLLIFGERRLRAARDLKLPRVPAVVVDASEYERAVLNLVENIQRTNLRGSEEVRGIADYVRQLGGPEHHAAQQASKMLGKPLRYIKDRLKVAAAPTELLKALDGRPDAFTSVLKALQLTERGNLRKAAALIEDGATKREVEAYVDEMLAVEQRKAETRERLAARLAAPTWTPQAEEETPQEAAKPATQGVGYNSGGTSRTEAPESAAQPEADPIADLLSIPDDYASEPAQPEVDTEARRAHEAEVLARPETQELADSLRPTPITEAEAHDKYLRQSGQEINVLQAPQRPSERLGHLHREIVRLEAEDAAEDVLGDLWREVLKLAREQV